MSNMDLKDWIVRLKQKSKTDLQNTVVLFDLDSTLFTTSPRTQFILREFAAHPQYEFQFPEISKKLKEIEVLETDWGIRSALERVLSDYDEEFIDLIREYWKTRFFSSEYLKHDTPYEGAVDFVNAVFDLGVQLKYLTARDEPRMGEGTRAQIKKWKLPHDPKRVQFHLKPKSMMSDTDFKVLFFQEFPRDWKEIWYFENEPTIIDGILKIRTDVKIIWLNTVHSHRVPEPTGLPWLRGDYRGF